MLGRWERRRSRTLPAAPDGFWGAFFAVADEEGHAKVLMVGLWLADWK